jgi:hypothetical protein
MENIQRINPLLLLLFFFVKGSSLSQHGILKQRGGGVCVLEKYSNDTTTEKTYLHSMESIHRINPLLLYFDLVWEDFTQLSIASTQIYY